MDIEHMKSKERKEFEKKLYDRFKFFHPEKPLTESLMKFGIECSNFWYDLIWKLSEDIEKELQKEENKELAEKFEVIQVKEKFGGLRYYPNFSNDIIFKLIYEAEMKSMTICEVCGKPGKPNETGWISTLCDDCRKEKNK